MKRRVCLYRLKAGGWQAECGQWTPSRPTQKCDKCGRKPEESKDVRST